MKKHAKVAINGLGRIGRATFKILLDTPELELVGTNDLIPVDNLAYLLKYDTVYGRYDKKVSHQTGQIDVEGQIYPVFSEKDPSRLPWKKLGVDIVFECTGVFRKTAELKKHLEAGAKHVILSAPAKDPEMATIVHGIGSNDINPQILSCASCTTNCVAPVVEIVGRRIGMEKATMTTIHAYTSSQTIVDGPRNKWRRGRAAAANFVPTSTGAAKVTTRVLPDYENRFDGVAVRGPIPVGSLADIVFLTSRDATPEELNAIFEEESQTPRYKGILGVTKDPIVSSDIIKDPRASIVDLTMTQVVDGNLAKVMSWYDNEWGYSNQMVRKAVAMAGTAS